MPAQTSLARHVTRIGLIPPSFQWSTRTATCLTILYASLIILPWLGSARTITAHEGYVVQGAREMVQTDDWLVPRVAGAPWLEKPPLPQWCAASVSQLLGERSAFTARLPGAVLSIFGVAVFTALVSRFRTPILGLCAGMILATSTYVVTYARLAESDIYLWSIVLFALSLYARSWVNTGVDSWAIYLAFFALLGATQLVKGMIFGAVMIGVPIAVWLVIHGGKSGRWFVNPIGWLIAAAVGLAWPIAVLQRYPEAFELWKYHTVGRLDSSVAYNPKPFWYYLTTIPWQIAPWTLTLLPALRPSLQRAWAEAGSFDRWLWVWFGSLGIVLSVVSGKHHHYLIYALPPCAVWAADGLPWWCDQFARFARSRWLVRGVMICFAVALGVGVWLGARQTAAPILELTLVALSVFVLVVGSVWACGRGEKGLAGVGLFTLIGGAMMYLNGVWLDRTDRFKVELALIERVRDRTQSDDTVIVMTSNPTPIMVYVSRPVVVANDAAQLAAALRAHPTAYIFSQPIHEETIRSVARVWIADRTPQPRWASRPLDSWPTVYTTREPHN